MDTSQAVSGLWPRGSHADEQAESITDRAQVYDILDALIRHGGSGVVLDRGKRIPATANWLEPDGAAIVWQLTARVGDVTLAELVGYNSVFRFTLIAKAASGTLLLSELPSELLRVRRRRVRRVRALNGERIVIEDRGHGARPTPTEPLLDFSYDGLAFCASGRPAVRVGTLLSGMRVIRRGELGVSLDGEIVAIDRSRDESIYRVRVCPATAFDLDRWRHFVDAALHPDTAVDPAYCGDVWRLYGDCGYFSLSGKTPECFSTLQSSFPAVMERISRFPDLGCNVVWPSATRGVSAALSTLKTYSHGWLGFQMAKISGDTPEGVSGRRVLREIHQRAYEHIQAVDPQPGWLIAYPQVKRVWSRAAHHDLPKRYEREGLAHIARFRALEYPCDRCIEGPTFSVSLATRSETASFGSWLERTRPPVYRDALDLVPDRMDFGAIRHQWRKAGLLRERCLLVAHDGVRPVAAAVLEVAAEATHVYRLLDLMRVYAIEPGGTDAFPALLDAGREFYTRYDKPSFVLFQEGDMELPDATVAQAYDMGFADMSILSAALAPELLEYVYQITAPKLPVGTSSMVR